VSSNGHNGWLRLLPQVEEMIAEQGIVVPGWRAGEAERKRFQDHLARALAGSHLVSDDALVVEAAGVLARASTGLGVLEEIADQPGIEEIVVRRGQVQVERYGRIEELGALASDDYFERLARRVADLGGRAMKADRPFVLVDLPSGSRFTAMIPPLSVEGTAINVRVFRQEALSLRSLAQGRTFDDPDRGTAIEMLPDDLEPELPEMARFLAWTMRDNAATVLISGEFSSGKTTLLNALTAYIAPTTQLAVVETFRELQIRHPFAARAVVPTPPRENFPSLDEVVNVLYTRMRPDLILFGEVVGNEAVELLSAMNLGKKVMTTIHANSAYDALLRLETLALESGMPLEAIRERVGRGVDIVVHMRKRDTRRFVAEIVRVRGIKDGIYSLEHLYGREEQVW
jgi:pilus assembly protein CpaF